MKRRDSVIIVLCLFLLFIFWGTKGLQAYNLVTAQEAFDMVSAGEASLIDVRTLEEYVFVGSPALEGGGDPIAYLIEWESLEGTNENGDLIFKNNPDFLAKNTLKSIEKFK